MNFLFLLLGAVAGLVIGWLWAKSKTSQVNAVPLEEFKESERLRITAEANLENLKEKLENQKRELDELQKKFTLEFENLANRIFEDKSKKFTEQNKTNIDIILNPLKEKISDFEKKVDMAYKSEAAERNTLRGEIKNLIETSNKIGTDANNLARALKGDQKQQGNWGELMLEKILERSGLIKGEEYNLQVSLESQESRRIQPDAIIYLPENKNIIIDSKVSLVAYESAVNATTDEEKKKFISQHLDSLKRHVKDLSEKNYPSAKGINAPDFVLMFIPIESSFSVAVQEDAELFNFAWDRNIVLVSPSTLLATLRTIASVWKQEKQSRHVLEIAEESGKLYDKFVGFVEDLKDVGNKMDQSKNSYVEAMKKLSQGSGNLVGRVEKIKKLGAKTTKALPPNLLERAEND